MASYTTTTTIDTGGTKGILSATKSGTYNEVVNITQVINNTDIFIPISSGSSTKSSFTHSMSDCKSMIIKNSGVSGAEIQLKTYQNTHGTPDVTASETFHSYLLGAGEYIYFPTMRQMSFSANASAANAYTLDNQASGGLYKALDNAAAGDAQLLNGAEFASGTTATVVTVDEAAYLFVGDLIRLEDEICEITSISGEEITVIRGTHGSTAATHANNTAIRLPLFNAYENFTAATGGYDKVQTNENGLYKSTNFYGFGRNTDGSGNRQSNGIVAGSISGKFYRAAYQELGLSGITSSTNTGLTASTAYEFDIQVDGGTNFDNLSFTTDSSNVNFGGTNGVIQKIQEALDTQFYTAGNLFGLKVNVSIVNGDVRFKSASYLATSEIILTAGSSGTAEFFGTGRIPTVAKLATKVDTALPPDTILDKKSGIESPNIAEMFYDDGHGNISGTCNGTVNYETGALDLRNCPILAEFVLSANYGSGHSGGNKFSSDACNSITSVEARRTNSKLNTTIELIGLN